MKRIAKWVCVFLALVLAMNCLTFYGAGDAAFPVETVTDSDVELEVVEESGVGEEIVEWREDGVRHYYLGDGQYQAVVSAGVTEGDGAMPAAQLPSTDPVEDTYISSGQPTTNYGTSDKLWVSNTQTAFVYCYLPSLPDNAYVDSARLYFNYYYNISTGYLSVGAYPVTFRWREATLTWNIANNRTNLGIGTTCVGTVSLYGRTDVTPAYVDITNAAKSWYETKGQTSFGIALKRRSGTNNSVILLSSEAESATAPYFVINYTLKNLPIQNGMYYVQNAIEFLDDAPESYWACFMQTNGNVSGQYDSEVDPETLSFCEMFTMNGLSQQKWELEYLHNGYYTIKSITETKVLAVQTGQENVANELFVRETFTGDIRQQWKITLTSNGSYKIKPRSSEAYETDWVMGISDATPCMGKNVKQIEYDGTDAFLNDEWYFHPSGGQVCMLAVDDGAIPFLWFLPLMEQMSEKGYNAFNIRHKDSFTDDEIKAYMAASTIYISITHGASHALGTSIITNADKSEEFWYDELYGEGVAKADLSNCELMLFLACEVGSQNEYSLCHAAVLAGAECVIGFQMKINSEDAVQWTRLFFENYNDPEYAVDECCRYAIDYGSYHNKNAIKSYKIFPDQGGN